MKEKVVVGLSGGKDSTGAILILQELNYNVSALTMKLGLPGENEKVKKIRHLSDVLKVPLRIVDLSHHFREKVIQYFINSYSKGQTPNPCVICNIYIKFDLLMKEALGKMGADFFATGHYARIVEYNNELFLSEPREKSKSQIYFLAMIRSEVLKKVIFPLSDISIEYVKAITNGLPLASKKESQDVCFLGNHNLVAYLKRVLPGSFFQDGCILDTAGNVLGTHKGNVHFTIGQRRGTGFSSDRKRYVVAKDVINNTITLGDEGDLLATTIKVSNPVLWRQPQVGDVYKTKIRYHSPFHFVEITSVSTKLIKGRFVEPVKSVTPGQICVFYQQEMIIAAGIIKL